MNPFTYMDRHEHAEAARSMVAGGIVLIILGGLVAWALGNNQKVIAVDSFSSAEEFNWTLAMIAFTPFFVSGTLMAALSAIVKRLPRDAQKDPSAAEAEEGP